jgi:hypothetical protein
MKLWKIVLLPMILIVLGCTESKQVSGPTVQHIDFVVKNKMGEKNLSSLARKVAKNTQTFRNIESIIGAKETNNIVNEELALTMKKYQGEWDLNLAEAHSEFLNSVEINSLYYNGKNSPFYEKIKKARPDIGKSMQNKSKDLLSKIVSEAVQKSIQSASLKYEPK